MQTNISSRDTSNFLKEGAFVRWQGTWYTFEGPFEPLDNAKSQVFSIVCQDFYGHRRNLLKASKVNSFDSASWRTLFKSEFVSDSRRWAPPSREFYSKSFSKIQQEIAS